MDSQWMQAYILFVLRLNRAIAALTQNTYLLDYYGDPTLEAQVEKEPSRSGALLLEDVTALRETLPHQTITPQRAAYLAAHLRAFEVMSRRVAGERIPLRAQARDSFDIPVEYLPESDFAHAHALYNEGLRGTGSITERLAQWRQHYRLAADKTHLIPDFMQRALREAHRRTSAIIPLPDAEVTIDPIRDQPIRAMAHYLGRYRSRILINPDYPFTVADLLYVVCHEAYPGHLAEMMLKEQHLQEQGYQEHEVSFLITPPYVLSEGIALWAHEMAFPDDEAEQWLATHIYPEAGIRADGSHLKTIQTANDLLMGVRCNAALMLDEGQSTRDVMLYLQHYELIDEAAAHRALASLQRPFCEAYPFTYFYGKQLLAPFLQGEQRYSVLPRLLTEQLLPSNFAEGRLITA